MMTCELLEIYHVGVCGFCGPQAVIRRKSMLAAGSLEPVSGSTLEFSQVLIRLLQ